MTPPAQPPRRITLDIMLHGINPKGRATLADANAAIGELIEQINSTELHNKQGETLAATVLHFEVTD